MRAIVQDRYGAVDELRLGEVARPEPAEDEVLVRVRAASVHPDVWHVVAGRPAVLRLMGSGVRRPKDRVPGTDVAGVVESVGARGDPVPARGRGVRRDHPRHAVAQRRRVRGVRHRARGRRWRSSRPGSASRRRPRCRPPGLIALNNLPQRRVPPGHRVLVNGAAGGVGAIAVQLAKAYGAHVTGVDHPRKLALVRSLGADRVIDYTREDYTRGGERWDLIFDVPGNHSFAETRRALEPGGAYVLIGARRVRRHRAPLARQHPAHARVDGALGRGPRAARWLVRATGQARADDHADPAPGDRPAPHRDRPDLPAVADVRGAAVPRLRDEADQEDDPRGRGREAAGDEAEVLYVRREPLAASRSAPRRWTGRLSRPSSPR